MKKHPQAGRSKLQQEIAPLAYSWLYGHDSKWLNAHMPPPYRRVGSARKVDWRKRDIEFSDDVRKAAQRLSDTQGCPVRVTKLAIGRDLDRKDWLSNKQIKKLPLTAKVLEAVLESRVEFAIRRVRWAAKCFLEEGLSPAWSTLAMRAHIDWGIWYVPELKAVIDAEWASLQIPGNNSISIAAA